MIKRKTSTSTRTSLKKDSTFFYSDSFKHIKRILINHVFKSGLFPLFSVLFVLCILLVFVRMKGVDQNLRYGKLVRKIEDQKIYKKELKLEEAKLMSVKNLQRLAKKHKLTRPKQTQIIVIPK